MQDEQKNQIKEIVDLIVSPLAGESDVNFLKEGDQWRIDIIVEDGTKLIGHHGELLSSIQHLVRVLFHKKNPGDRTHFLVDVNSYKHKRESFINEEIPKIAEAEVLGEGRPVIISGLSSYERRIIHNMIADVKGVETTSVGERYSRRLIIRPTSESNLGMDKARVIDIKNIASSKENQQND